MQKNNKISIEGISPPRSKNQIPLPNIKQRKLSLQQEDPRYVNQFNKKTSIKYQKNNINNTKYNNSIQEQQQTVFSAPKQTIFYVKKPQVIKIAQKQKINSKIYDALECQMLKKQIEELKIIHNPLNFHPQIIVNSQQPSFYVQNSPKQFNYQPYKRKANIAKQKLKPIVSEVAMKQGQLQFFNVGKIIINNHRDKAKSMKIKPLHSIKQTLEVNQKRSLNSNTLKQRLKLSSQAVYIHELKQKSKKQLFSQIDPIIIQTVHPRSIYGQSELQFRKQTDLYLQRDQSHQEIKIIQKFHLHPAKTQTVLQQQSQPIKTIEKKIVKKITTKKFNPPYQTYYYRDLIWKVNFSNQMLVQIPIQYQHRLRAYIGKGNNSCMVAGLIARRPWFAFTDKQQQANLVWTQLKVLSFYKKQQQIQRQFNYENEAKNNYVQESILLKQDNNIIKSYFKTYLSSEQHADQKMVPRMKLFKYNKIIKNNEIKQLKLHNHLINNYILGNKKALFNTMSNYYQDHNLNVFDFLPLTFHIKDGLQDKKYFQFLKYFHKRAKQINRNNQKSKIKQYNTWIVKPGQNSNRGNGIKMCLNLQQIKAILKIKERYTDGSYRTFIVQAYIQRPLLYFKRKFDIRHYIMMTCINGIVKGYWYKYGYVRTTSSEYSLKDNSGSIHLTNDAVQKNLPDYGKYEKGNKISYDDLSAYIDKYHHKKGHNFYEHIYPKMKRIATDAMKACSGGIDPNKFKNNFQIFGMDFMIDSNLEVWLIEINTNPCLQLSCPLLGCIIPKMVQNALEQHQYQLRLTMDAMFPPPVRYTPKGVHYYKQLQKQNKFELVFDERHEPLYKGCLKVLDNKLLQQQDDTFQDCGQQWQDK